MVDNVGERDAILRNRIGLGLWAASLAAYFFWMQDIGLYVATGLFGAAVALWLTAHFRFCPVWFVLRRSTVARHAAPAAQPR